LIELEIGDDDYIMVNGEKWKGMAFKRALKDWIKQ